MTDAEYAFLVASHGDAVPPRHRIRLNDNQVPALDSLLRVMRDMGIDQDVRITAIFSQAGGRTRIDKEFTARVDPRSAIALCHEISFWQFEQRFEEIARGEHDCDE
jgi:hypothetical protein